MLLAAALALAGCGQTQTDGAKPAAQAKTAKTAIGTTKVVSQGQTPAKIQATDSAGKRVVLDLRDGPVLVAAWWCPHCAALLARSDLPGLPRVVTVWPQYDQTLKQTLQAEESMMQADGWQGDWSRGLFAAATVPGVNSVPTLLYFEDGKVKALQGETMAAAEVAKVTGGKVAFTKTGRE